MEKRNFNTFTIYINKLILFPFAIFMYIFLIGLPIVQAASQSSSASSPSQETDKNIPGPCKDCPGSVFRNKTLPSQPARTLNPEQNPSNLGIKPQISPEPSQSPTNTPPEGNPNEK